jgi:drug/metabolite transporter (DMT)-like permease
MTGLRQTDTATALLLLTLEGATTALIAWFIFHDNFDRRTALGMFCIAGDAAILSWSGAPTFDGVVGPIAIVGLAWRGAWEQFYPESLAC